MMTWIRAVAGTSCGSCTAAIQRNVVMLEIRIGAAIRRRCEPCGAPMYLSVIGEGPLPYPDELPPAQPKATRAQRMQRQSPFVHAVSKAAPRPPDFVTAGQLTRSTVVDFRRRQSGDDA